MIYSGKGNREIAETLARTNGKTTLEMIPGGSCLDSLDLFGSNSSITPEEALKVWGRLSERYAQQANGVTYGVVDGASARGVFNTIELPALKDNPNVTNLITELITAAMKRGNL